MFCTAKPVELTVTCSIALASGHTMKGAIDSAKKAITAYLKNLALRTPEDELIVVRVASIGAMLYSLDEILDYSDLALNGGMENITIAVDSVAVLKEVAFDGLRDRMAHHDGNDAERKLHVDHARSKGPGDTLDLRGPNVVLSSYIGCDDLPALLERLRRRRMDMQKCLQGNDRAEVGRHDITVIDQGLDRGAHAVQLCPLGPPDSVHFQHVSIPYGGVPGSAAGTYPRAPCTGLG